MDSGTEFVPKKSGGHGRASAAHDRLRWWCPGVGQRVGLHRSQDLRQVAGEGSIVYGLFSGTSTWLSSVPNHLQNQVAEGLLAASFLG